MFGPNWQTSERKHRVMVERELMIPMSDGVLLNADIWRPDCDGRFPVLLGLHPYDKRGQTAPLLPRDMIPSGRLKKGSGREKGNASLESGDPNFYARRGYVHLVANVRGTGSSEGEFQLTGPREVQDGYDLIEWAAGQPWCDGNVGMLGISYFAFLSLYVAALDPPPPHLKAVFAPCASTDQYRDNYYHGGILGFEWQARWCKSLRSRPYNYSLEQLGREKYLQAIERLLEDEEINSEPALLECLQNPELDGNSLVVDFLLNPQFGPYWRERVVDYSSIKVPCYLGCCWDHYGLHLPAAFRSWESISAPKMMHIGPMHLDRPMYQLAYLSLRWFDHWLKGRFTGIMDEAPIRIFVNGTDDWRETDSYPLPETRWTPFYLHEKGYLFEREHWPNEGQSSYDDSPWGRGAIEFWTAHLVEQTEVIGDVVLNLFASTTDDEALFFVTLVERDGEHNERILSRGYLRGSQRAIDPDRSKPWRPYHNHDRRDPLVPGEIYEFNIPLAPVGSLFRAGSRIGLRIRSTDDEPAHEFEPTAARGHIRRQVPARITLYHNEDYPSHLLLPITRGNLLETFISNWTAPDPH
ncbi:MAG: CocE/NonD family hydrolase [Spirochaetaceae bacterium]|nr:MAG: CocE/NonD family hydrolase [Spirochaetaceae bacterium]